MANFLEHNLGVGTDKNVLLRKTILVNDLLLKIKLFIIDFIEKWVIHEYKIDYVLHQTHRIPFNIYPSNSHLVWFKNNSIHLPDGLTN